MSGKAKMWGAAGVLFIVMMPVLIMPTIGITLVGALLGNDDVTKTMDNAGKLSDMGFINPVPTLGSQNIGGTFMHPGYGETQKRNHTGLDIANVGDQNERKNHDVISPFNGKLIFTKYDKGNPDYCKEYKRYHGPRSEYYWKGGGGNTVMLVTQLPDNPKIGIFMSFNHLNSIAADLTDVTTKGEASIDVEQGHVLGKVGGTNDSDDQYSPHLHITAGYINYSAAVDDPEFIWSKPCDLGETRIVDPLWFFQGLDFACKEYTRIYIGGSGHNKGEFDKQQHSQVYESDEWFKKSTVGCRVEE